MDMPTKSHTGLHHDLRRRAPDILLEPCLMLDPSVPDCGVMVLLPAHDIVKDLCLLNDLFSLRLWDSSTESRKCARGCIVVVLLIYCRSWL
jgi:hypothetical protein